MSNAGDALAEGMAGKEPGRTSRPAVVMGNTSVLSLTLGRGELCAEEHKPLYILWTDTALRHRETRPVAEAVLKICLF